MAALLTWTARRPLARAVGASLARGARRNLLLAGVLLPPTSGLLANVDQMYSHGNAYVEELSGNGLFSFAAAFRRNELDYERWYATLPPGQADRILRDPGVEREPLSTVLAKAAREAELAEPAPGFLRRRPHNVVQRGADHGGESLGRVSRCLRVDARPEAETRRRGAARGAVRARARHRYAHGARARGAVARHAARPPVPGQAIVRRPDNEHLATVGEILEHQGFEIFFVYGGYGYFDNMNAYFAGDEYITYDRTEFPQESVVFENIWGVAEEVLFDNAMALLDRVKTPDKRFFMHIMTSPNHRPFTYPDGRIDIPSPGGREGAVKYTDYAIGRLIEQAQTHAWFADTLFVIIADHCASVAGKTELPIAHYHIPLILYGPAVVKPGRVVRPISQIDPAPTVFDVLGIEGDDHFFGNGVHEQAEQEARAFVSNYQSPGYYKRDVLTVLKPKRRVESFRIDPKSFEATPAAVDPTLRDEAIAYYQTASSAFKQRRLKAPGY